MIKNYKDFIKEKIEITQSDTPDIASGASEFNKMEEDIKEFMAKKVTIDNIYLTYTNEKDLISKLSAQKFIPLNTSDKKQVKFNNPLIGMYAAVSKKRRELKSLEDQLKEKTDILSNAQSSLNGADDVAKPSITQTINSIQEGIRVIKTDIDRIRREISDLEKETNDKLNQMKKDLISNKNRMGSLLASR